METLRNAKVGQTVKVVKLHGEGAVKRRLMDWVLQGEPRFISVRLHRSAIRLKLRFAITSFRFVRRMPK